MRFILELDGIVFDVREAFVRAHGEAAASVGWARMEAGAFWRRMRKQGADVDFLQGARPLKQDEYRRAFAERIESDDCLDALTPHEDIRPTLATLQSHGGCVAVTLRTNVPMRKRAMDRAGVSGDFERVAALNADPRRRPAELRVLAGGDPRTIVVASSDGLIRAAGAAELLAVGVPTGACHADRFHRAGAALVYRSIDELVTSLARGGEDLIRAGLLPCYDV